MAKTPTPEPEAGTVNNDVATTVELPIINADLVATAENTPVPGGGSWHWDDALADYVENAPYAPPIPLVLE